MGAFLTTSGSGFASAHRRRVPERDEEVEEVQPGEEGSDGQQEHQGLVPDDQEDASAPEGPLQLFNPSPSGRGMHEELPGTQVIQWPEL